MAEVFTISGASPADQPGTIDYARAHPQSSSGPSGSPPAMLQNALRALGAAHGDGQLTGVHIDGVIGPATVKAVNHALATYIGSTPGFPAANLTLVKVRQYAGALAAIVTDGVRRSGGTIPPLQMSRAVVHRSAGGAVSPTTSSQPSTDFDHRWIWWAVGGVGVLLLLTVAATAAKKRKAAAA